jgi:YHS domain-containing protein
MTTLKRINGRHIVTIDGQEYYFKSIKKALTFIFRQ